MMKIARMAAASVLALQLSACGGGGGGDSGVNSAPPPIATPTPTAAPKYTRIQDLTGDQTFSVASASFVYPGGNDGLPSPSGRSGAATIGGLTLSYQQNSNTYFIAGYGTSRGLPQAKAVVESGDPKTVVLKNNPGGSASDILRLTTPSPGGIDLSYVRFGSWMTTFDGQFAPDPRLTYFVAGVPTIASDVPTTGTATFTAISVIGIAADTRDKTFYDLARSTATFSADFGANTVQTTLNLIGTATTGGAERNFGTFNGNGNIGDNTLARNRHTFAGVATANGSANVTFEGVFFGPQASEFAYAWSIFQLGLVAEGAVAGRR